MHAFITSHLDYCKSVTNSSSSRMPQYKEKDHITPLLTTLLRLLSSFRIGLKVLLLVYKALHKLAAYYISDCLLFCVPTRTFRSSTAFLLGVLLEAPLCFYGLNCSLYPPLESEQQTLLVSLKGN